MKLAFLPGVTRKEGHPDARTLEHGGEVALSGRIPGKKFSEDLGSPAGVIVRTILIFLISQVLAVILVGVVYSALHPGHSVNLNDSVTAQFFYILIAEGLAAWLAIWLVKHRNLSFKVIGLGRRPRPDDLYKALIGFGIFYVLLIAAGLIVNSLSPDLNNQKQDLGFNNLANGTENILAFISLVILPPLGEEVLVRGYLFSGLRKYWRFWPALLITSLFFGVAHLEFGSGGPLVWAAAIDTSLLSIILCFLRERTGALYAGMLVHMLNNLIAFFVVIK